VPAIGHLNSAKCGLARRFCVDAAAVPAYDLSAGMLPQPPNHGLGLTIRQQVDDLALFQVAEDRAVAMALPPCPVVDTEDAI
jgi:hypothetical protein